MFIKIHRRLLVDDYKGVAEALNEQEFSQGMVARGKHLLIFGTTENSKEGVITNSIAQQEHELELRQALPPYTLVANATDDSLSLDKIKESLKFQVSPKKNRKFRMFRTKQSLTTENYLQF